MTTVHDTRHEPRFVNKEKFGEIFALLRQRGYTVIGPTIQQNAIVYAELRSVEELPRGWADEQTPGKYRVERRSCDVWFGFNVGSHSWKAFLFPPHTVLEKAESTDEGWQFTTVPDDPPKYAFLGVRACELAAMRVQDRVFMSGAYVDPIYHARRGSALIIAVNCTQAASTCFCTSMESGPECTSGFDLALTELSDGFVLESATAEGAEITAALTTEEVTIEQLQSAQHARQQAVTQITRKLDTTDIRDTLLTNLTHPHWETVAERCLSCANCTMVCPTCFCSSVTEVSDLRGEHVRRERHWDSCFNVDFSYINGGNVRDSVRSRYRQWLTHKLASWIDQFDTSGCVGCGRCITWCPVGIDLTEEVAAIRGESP